MGFLSVMAFGCGPQNRRSVPTNALGSRNATGRISWEQTSERIVAVWGKRPGFVARLPTQIVNDKGRYHAVQVRMEFAFFIPLWRVALLIVPSSRPNGAISSSMRANGKSRTIEHYDALRLFA
jgi:hypothetical protein